MISLRLGMLLLALICLKQIAGKMENEEFVTLEENQHVSLLTQAIQQQSVSEDSTMCETCILFVDLAEKYATDEDTLRWMEKYLRDHVCPNIPEDFRHECRTLAILISEELADWIRDNLSAEQVCQRVAMCSSVFHWEQLLDINQNTLGQQINERLVSNLVQFKVNDKYEQLGGTGPIKASNFDACHYCMETMEGLQELLGDPDRQDEIVADLEKGCSLLKDYKDMCLNYVDAYVPAVIDLALQYLDPDECVDLGYCDEPTGLMD